MQPDPRSAKPAMAGGFAVKHATGQVGLNCTPRRCPWHADVIRLAASPVAPYESWRGCALVFAGSDSWAAARPTREAGRRACTVLPPGDNPAAIAWPQVANWIGDAGDLEGAEAVALVRELIAAGARLVILRVPRLPEGSLIARRAG